MLPCCFKLAHSARSEKPALFWCWLLQNEAKADRLIYTNVWVSNFLKIIRTLSR